MNKRTPKISPDPIDVYVGSRIKARRVGLRMSQTKLGQAIGVTFQQIQKYENGTNRVGASNLHKIASMLGVDVGYFYDGVPSVPDTPPEDGQSGLHDVPQVVFESDPMASREAIELMHNFFRIKDPQIRKRVFQFVRSLANRGEAD